MLGRVAGIVSALVALRGWILCVGPWPDLALVVQTVLAQVCWALLMRSTSGFMYLAIATKCCSPSMISVLLLSLKPLIACETPCSIPVQSSLNCWTGRPMHTGMSRWLFWIALSTSIIALLSTIRASLQGGGRRGRGFIRDHRRGGGRGRGGLRRSCEPRWRGLNGYRRGRRGSWSGGGHRLPCLPVPPVVPVRRDRRPSQLGS